jgi:uncharacterized protein
MSQLSVHRWLSSALTLFALWLISSTVVLAQEIVPVPPLSGRVVDQTNTLTPPQVLAMMNKMEAIENQRGVQMVILIVPTTQPESIAEYSQRVGDAWKLGRKDVGDGLLIVVALNDRRINIAPAKMLEGVIPDVVAGRIINQYITPAFKVGDYVGGLNAAIDRLGERIMGETMTEAARPTGGGHGLNRSNLQNWVIFLFVGVPVAGALLSAIFGRKFGSVLTGGAVGGLAWWLTTSLLVAGAASLVTLFVVGVMGLGNGRFRRAGGPVIWSGGIGGGFGGGSHGGTSGGGGFSSGGGGDFGGGGASGGW